MFEAFPPHFHLRSHSPSKSIRLKEPLAIGMFIRYDLKYLGIQHEDILIIFLSF